MTKQDVVPARTGAISLFSPRNEMFGNLQREIDSLFEDFTRGFERFGATVLSPRVDVAETEGAVEITAELPGLEAKDVEIGLSEDLLTISGEKRSEFEKADKHRRVSERSYGAFSRTIQLPPGVDADKITATMDKGVLKISAPRGPSIETRKIAVQAAK